MARRRAVVIGAVAAAAGFALYPGLTDMAWMRSHHQDLRRLLGSPGDALVSDEARIAAWAPDANYQPQGYYLLRAIDEPGLRALAQRVGLVLAPPTTGHEAVWRLPQGVELAGWAADALAPGTGLQSRGTLGGAAVWLRWHQGQAFIVVLPSGP